ncbi:exodeoxyribonuclease III [Marinimicrococcus flavescens]|uniref:Exodeoxyribonuclease III n=1 Tax=Marinimicrococcus flavescens TaxID=3031815 RepID=A0AAP3XQU6_9PROT|nr:exodeoxyribonuclease III [Marinimicrococcus flavescens]
MRITTWNANSVRLRETALRRIALEIRPDVLCLQETKVEDGKFPREMAEALGYHHLHIHGQKAYHGVAILSKLPLEDCHSHKWCGIEDSRHAVCTLPGGIEIHDLYIPAGGDIPDPEVNPKFRHKLAMVADLTDYFAARRGDGAKVVLVGDLNIAPLETDVWSHRQLLKVVSHTPVETEALNRLQASYGFLDAVRAVIPPEQKLFTWWSYRNRDWAASDRGRRLDHVWLSPALAPALRGAEVCREARGWDMPSDHVPVTVELEV